MECRGLIPIAKDLVKEHFEGSVRLDEQHIKQCTLELCACYDCLSALRPFASDNLAAHAHQFPSLFVALEGHMGDMFRIKPKIHLFQEMCEEEFGGRPACTWTCRGEDFGDTIAGLGMRRGGANTPTAVGKQVLNKFAARHRAPDLK